MKKELSRALKREYYSQHGEDFILEKIFKNRKSGYFVEVGCIDGLRFSNTLFFEKLGWHGLCIEAHRDYIDAIKTNRKDSKVIHCAIGGRDEKNVKFYANSRGSLSTLDNTAEAKWKKDYAEYFDGFEEQNVPLMTLSTVFKEENVTDIDILSIDIEGTEIEAIKGIDFELYKPKVIVVEYNGDRKLFELKRILEDNGYHHLLNIGGNAFFSVEKQKIRINERIKIRHTSHPLDATGDNVFLTLIRIGYPSWTGKIDAIFNKGLHKIRKLLGFYLGVLL